MKSYDRIISTHKIDLSSTKYTYIKQYFSWLIDTKNIVNLNIMSRYKKLFHIMT